MANTYKNIVITPSIGSNSADPKIVFSGANTNTNTDITVFVYPTANGTLSFEGSVGQLFSITNDLSNNIFRAADVSGVPLIDAFANGLVALVPTSGNVGIANTTPAHKLSVNGSAYFLGNVTVGNSSVNASVFSNSSGVYFGGTALTANNANNLNGKTEGNLNVNNATYLGSTVNLGNSSGIFSTGGVVSGSATDGQVLLTDSVNGGVEIGKTGRTSSGTPYIDFHSSASSPDYDVRVMASSGNSTAGSGALTVYHGGSNTFFAANGNFGIGNSAPAHKFSVNGTGYFGGQFGINISPQNNVQLQMGGTLVSGTATSYSIYSSGTIPSSSTTGGYNYISALNTQAASFTCGTLMHFGAYQGTIGAGSTVTNQYGFFASGTLVGAGTNNYGFYGDIAAGTGRYNFFAGGTAANYFGGPTGVGAGTTAFMQFRIGGTAQSSSALSYSSYADQTAPAATTDEFASYYSIPNTTAATFTLGALFHYIAVQGTFGAGSTVTNQYGFYVGSNMTGATSNYGYYSNIPAGSNRWNLFMNGTAVNYLNGNTGIGNTAPTHKLSVNGLSYLGNTVTLGPAGGGNEGGEISWSGGNSSFNGWTTDVYTSTFRFFTPGAGSLGNGQVQMFSSNASHNVGLYVQGNTGIGTSAPAYKLDVSGTAHITGAVTLDTALTVGSGGTGATTITGLVKGNGTSAFTAGARGTDYSLLTAAASVASTSGTSIDFTGIPSGVKTIILLLSAVSTNGTSNLLIQIGDSGGVENTGYSGGSTNFAASSLGVQNFSGSGFSIFDITAATSVHHAEFMLTNISGNTWVCSGSMTRSDTNRSTFLNGTKTLSATLDRVRVTTNNGTDAFDAGTINIFYEY